MFVFALNPQVASRSEVATMEVDGEITRLQRQIEKVENDIEKVENALQAGDLKPEDKKYLREKESQLREEKSQLREETRALREKENKLLDLKLEKERYLREKEDKLLDLKLEEKRALREEKRTSDSLAFDEYDKVISVLKQLWMRAKAFKLEQLEGFVEISELKILSMLSISVPDRMGLYVRECFSDFYRKLMNASEKHKFVHVNGTPGVGKSAFLWYVVLRAAIACEFDVIVELGHASSRTSAGIVFYRNGSVNYSPSFMSLKICGDGPVLHLVDQVFLGHHFGKNIIIFADNIKDVFTCGGGSLCQKVMPSWRNERKGFLLLCLKELPNANFNEIWEQVKIWGMIPRVVFDMKELAYFHQRIDEVIGKCNLEQCRWWDVQVMACKLFELDAIDAEYEIGSVRFASKHLGERFWQHFWNTKRDELMAFLKSSAGMEDVSALRGFIYENCLIGSWTDTCNVVLHARSLQDGSPLCLNVGQRILRHFSSPLEIRAAHAANEDLTKILWVPRKNNPLYDALAFPNLIVQATVADGETSGHDVLQMALINTATFMWELNNYQQVIFLVVVPTDGVLNWKSSSLNWKNSKGEDLKKFRSLLNNIGLYVTGYDPFGLDSKDVPEDDGLVWKGLNAEEHANLVNSLLEVKDQACKRVLQKRKASSLDDWSAIGSKCAVLLPELEMMNDTGLDDCDADDDMAEHPLNEAEIRRAI